MYINANSIDDLMVRVIQKVINDGCRVKATRGESSEIRGVLLELEDPLKRLSRSEHRGKVFSAIGELLWYLSGDNRADFIIYYISAYKDEVYGKRVLGGYGPRLFKQTDTGLEKISPFERVYQTLKQNPGSRRAIIPILYPGDVNAKRRKEIPCTSTLQFLNRNGRLDLIASLRSNDAIKGLPHDVFAFTMIQELMARKLDLELGTYKQMVGSLHIYEGRDMDIAKNFIHEGLQEKVSMPPMPSGDQSGAISILLEIESLIRNNQPAEEKIQQLSSYWADIARLLKIHGKGHKKSSRDYRTIKSQMHSHFYDMYINKKAR